MKKTRSLAIGILTAAVGLLFYCGSFYVKSYLENRQAEERYDSIREIGLERQSLGADQQKVISSDRKGEKTSDQTDLACSSPGKQNAGLPKKKTIDSSFGVSWKALRKINPEVIGWIEVPGADISYPVVQGTDDSYYLHHSFSKEKDAFGTIFLGTSHKKDFQDSHSFLYGHNMEGNMMFANLNRYEEREFWEACPVFYIYTPERLFCYQIFSVQQAEELSPGFQYGHALGSKAYEMQLKMLSENSMYKTEVPVHADASMVTLVTCNSSLDEKIRMTVHGILTEEWTQEEWIPDFRNLHRVKK